MEDLHGGNIYKYNSVIDFSANVNPCGISKAVIRAVNAAAVNAYNYPDLECVALRNAIADYEMVEPWNIICGNGASDIIYRLVLALKPKKALLIRPCFSEYERALRSVGADIEYYDVNADTYDVDGDIIKYISDDIDILFICNPNNPTGKSADKTLINKIKEKCIEKDIFLCVDECFYDFADDKVRFSLKSEAIIAKNVLVIRAFTKMYGMAGIRLGYGITGNIEIIKNMIEAGPSWNVSSIAQAAGIEAIKDREWVEKTRKLIFTEKEYLYREFDNIGIRYIRGDANYIFFMAGSGLKEKLIAKGILIRDCSNFEGLFDGYYRVAVRTHADNEKLINALKEVI